MRDKLIDLKGKMLAVQNLDDGLYIKAPMAKTWHEKIIEVGDDYFIVEHVWTPPRQNDPRKPIIWAISAVKKISGEI
ncbi:MAG: hypothetical protein HGB08_00145 [Candidatus Moranbacteria bacterium]|nr:hypothetical protein [Candidatus Moranbacteria bacterium]